MADIVFEEKGTQTGTLSITVTKADYEPKLNAELNKARKNAHLKGFRKGKTPMGMIKKMHGVKMLSQIVNDQVEQELADYVKSESIQLIGQPIPSEDQADFSFDINNLEDYTFKIDLGIQPEFELIGYDADNVFDTYAVEIPEEEVDEVMNNARKQLGTQEPIGENDTIEENDIVHMEVEESEDGKVKKNGWATTVKVLVKDIVDEDFKKKVTGSKIGDEVAFDVTTLEKDRDEDHIRKYILNVEENDQDLEIGNHFQGKISSATRLKEAELDEEFFEKAFGKDEVKDEGEARARISENISKQFKNQSDAILYRNIQDDLIEKNQLDLPHDFLKRWISITNPNLSQEAIEKDYEGYEKSMRWTLIRDKIIKQASIEVSQEEILEGFKNQIRGYFGGSMDNELIVLNTASRLMEDREQVNRMYSEMLNEKLFQAMSEVIGTNEKKVSKDEFEDILKSYTPEPEEEVSEPIVEDAVIDDSAENAPEEEVTEDVEQ